MKKEARALVRFGGHVTAGAVIFVLFAAASVGTDLLVGFAKGLGASEFTLFMLGLLSSVFMILDVVLVTVYSCLTAFRFIRDIYRNGE